MNRSTSIVIAIAFLFLSSMTKLVSAQVGFLLLFNNGTAPTATKNCTPAEMEVINTAITNAPSLLFGKRRHLRNSGNYSFSYDDEPSRGLQSKSQACKKACDGYVAGTCRSAKCLVRRSLEGKQSRDLFLISNLFLTSNSILTSTCESAASVVLTALDKLISAHGVGPLCRAFIARTNRKTECKLMEYGEIKKINVVNYARFGELNVVKSDLPVTGYTVCSNSPFTMQAIGDECTTTVKFDLSGPWSRNEKTDVVPPYTMTQQDSANYYLPGEYKLTVTPNDNTNGKKLYNFTVAHC